MGRTFNLLNQNCQLAARLISDAQDRPLDSLERAGLAIHLMGCRNCRRHRRQVQAIDQIVKETHTNDTANVSLTPDARQRIAQRLAAGQSPE